MIHQPKYQVLHSLILNIKKLNDPLKPCFLYTNIYI